jgi:hypothetical protein
VCFTVPEQHIPIALFNLRFGCAILRCVCVGATFLWCFISTLPLSDVISRSPENAPAARGHTSS